MAVYAAVLATLLYSDKAALKKQWGLWRRVALRAVIVVGALAAVSITATEACQVDMAECHRAFSEPALLGFLIVIPIIAVLSHYFSDWSGHFWRQAAKRADLVLSLFAMEQYCLVDHEPPDVQRKDFAGPFKLLDRVGHTHRVYIDYSRMNEIQERVSRWLSGEFASCAVHVLDPKETSFHSENWNIDEHIGVDTYEEFKDNKGDLYALTVYEMGEPRSSIIKKEIWEEAAHQFGRAGPGFDLKQP